MNDPRRGEYRAGCQAAARRGVVRVRWPKSHALFVSNLNDNVNEQLLREEISTCGPVSFVKIPTLHGRSLGLAHVELQLGVEPDRFMKEFHGRELLGQKMDVVVDQGAKKFEQAVQNIKFPKKVETTKEAPKASPKKRARATDSPTYSPASPARPVSDCDGPSPSKPKRPRCSSPMPSPHPREGTRPSGDHHHDTKRSHGERQFSHNRRDSYRGHEPYPRTYSENFSSEGPRDYRASYRECRDQYDHPSSFHHRNRFHPGHSRHRGHDGYGDRPSHPPMHRDRYNEYSRHDRRNDHGYMDRNRSPHRSHESGYDRNHLGRYGNYNTSVPSNMRQRFPCDKKRVDESVWLDDIRSAITIKQVPSSTVREELLYELRHFHPRNAVHNGLGNWTMWFDSVEDRNRAADAGWIRFRSFDLKVKASSHVVGRKSTSKATPEGVRRHEEYTCDFDKRYDSSTERHRREGFGPRQYQRHDERYSRRDGRYEDRWDASLQQRRSSGLSSTYRGADNRFNSRMDSCHRPPDSAHENTPGRHSSGGGKAGKYNAKERHDEEARRRAHGDGYPFRGERDEHRRKREASADESAHASRPSRDAATDSRATARPVKEGARTTNSDTRENARKGDVTKNTSSERRNPISENQAVPSSKDKAEKIRTPPQDLLKVEQNATPADTSKKFTVEELADIVAQQVYRTAKASIESRGSAVQKSLVAQSVGKFVKSRRENEINERARAKQAALTSKKADKNATETAGGALSSALRTAHRDLVETFLKPAKPKIKKPPLPDRQSETASKKRVRRSRFAEIRAETEKAEKEAKAGLSVYEDEEPSSPEDRRGIPIVKRRRLSPGSPDPRRTSPDGNRQNSVESLASSELFREKDLHLRRERDENKKSEESGAPHDTILNIEKPEVRQAKTSSLKLSSPSTGEGSIPHLVLSTRPPPSPAASGPVGSTFTTSEDSTSQGLPKPSGIAKKTSSKKAKTGAKNKKKGSRDQARLSRKHIESATDDEQYADVLLSLNDKLKNSRSAPAQPTVEIFPVNGFIDVDRDHWVEKERVEAENVKDPRKKADDRKVNFCAREQPERVAYEECEPPGRVGKCARTDIYVSAEHVGQHRQRNVHFRTSTSTQSSRECRQENRVYRKGVSRINPKNDIISLNHLKQRRKKVSFGQSRIHGMGLFAKEGIEAGEFIIEYVGDLIRRVVADLREKKYARRGMGDSYLFRLSGDWVVDATRRGGIARYINHSCDPNVIAKIISVVGEPKIVFYSKRSIKEGEELTYDYKFDYEAEDKKIPCLCQAATCRKYLN